MAEQNVSQDFNDFDYGYSSIFIPSKGFWLTPLLIDINLLVFILMAISGVGIMDADPQKLLDWGGNLDRSTFGGEPWRLLTSVFLHGGMMHVFMNMYGLLYLGIMLELSIGSGKTALCYLLAGIGGSLSSAWWNYRIVSVGASGAIFGLDGMFLVMLLIRKELFGEYSKQLLISIGIFMVYNLAYGFAKTGIDNSAHLGGLICGMLYGLFLAFSLKPGLEASMRKLFFSLSLIVPGFLILGGWALVAKPIGEFYPAEDKYQQNWDAADSIREVIGELNNDSLIGVRLAADVIPIWKQNRALVEDMRTAKKSALEKMKYQYGIIADKNIERNLVILEVIETGDTSKFSKMRAADAEWRAALETLKDLWKD